MKITESSAMVPIHFSQLIGEMRGTSHVSWTTWVGSYKINIMESIYHILLTTTRKEMMNHILQV